MPAYLLVFIGGGLGSIFRFGISQMLKASTFPWATFTANTLSCIVLGFLVGLSMKGGLSDSGKLLFMTGFCGGFSTFSTFTNENYQLFLQGNHAYALANIAGSLLLCLLCIYIGIRFSNAMA